MQLTHLAEFIAERFIARSDCVAIQKSDGSYAPRQRPFTIAAIEDHIVGKQRLGHYLLNHDDRCRLMAFDIDFKEGEYQLLVDPWSREAFSPSQALLGDDERLKACAVKYLRGMGESLGAMAMQIHDEVETVLYGFSGNKGLHVYCLFPALVPAQVAQALAQDTMLEFNRRVSRHNSDATFRPVKGVNFWAHPTYPGMEIECFPKQAKKSRYGNLMRLPYGIHAKSGEAGFFIDASAPLHELKPMTELPV